MRTPLLTTSEEMANLQAAVYDRRRSRNCCIAGGHRPPLQSDSRYLAEQGVGFHPLALGSFLKSELVK